MGFKPSMPQAPLKEFNSMMGFDAAKQPYDFGTKTRFVIEHAILGQDRQCLEVPWRLKPQTQTSTKSSSISETG